MNTVTLQAPTKYFTKEDIAAYLDHNEQMALIKEAWRKVDANDFDITEREFWVIVKGFDPTYRYSDSLKTWQNGERVSAYISQAIEKDEAFKHIWELYVNNDYNVPDEFKRESRNFDNFCAKCWEYKVSDKEWDKLMDFAAACKLLRDSVEHGYEQRWLETSQKLRHRYNRANRKIKVVTLITNKEEDKAIATIERLLQQVLPLLEYYNGHYQLDMKRFGFYTMFLKPISAPKRKNITVLELGYLRLPVYIR